MLAYTPLLTVREWVGPLYKVCSLTVSQSESANILVSLVEFLILNLEQIEIESLYISKLKGRHRTTGKGVVLLSLSTMSSPQLQPQPLFERGRFMGRCWAGSWLCYIP